MNSSKKKKNVSAFDENDFVPINLVYNYEICLYQKVPYIWQLCLCTKCLVYIFM